MLQSFPSVRLVALDLDGTLLSRNNEVTPATREAIARAVAHGVAVVPATGRPLASLPPVVAKLPGIRYAITSNGAAVWDLGDDPMGAVYSRYSNAAQRHTSEPACLLHRLMPTETAREAFALFQKYSALAESARAAYVERCGPLRQMDAAADDRFTWVDGPWPWEGQAGQEVEC